MQMQDQTLSLTTTTQFAYELFVISQTNSGSNKKENGRKYKLCNIFEFCKQCNKQSSLEELQRI